MRWPRAPACQADALDLRSTDATSGLASSGGIPLCFFDTFGNVVAANALFADGGFGNPTNGSLADGSHGRFFGALGAELACASGLFGPCDGTVAPALPMLAALAAAVHATQRTPARASAPARNPQQATVTAPMPPIQPSLPNPSTTVPAKSVTLSAGN